MRPGHERSDPPWWFVGLIVGGIGLLAIDWARTSSTLEVVGGLGLAAVVVALVALMIQYQRGSYA